MNGCRTWRVRTRRTQPRAASALAAATLATLLLMTATAAPARSGALIGVQLGPLTKISSTSPFGPLESCGDFDPIGDTNFVHAEVEPTVVVNPRNPANIVAITQQDRWGDSDGSRGHVARVSQDGGATFRSVPIPGLTACTGGSMPRAVDPWLTFGARGDLYQASIVLQPLRTASQVMVSRSPNGGMGWAPPKLVFSTQTPNATRKPTLHAHPALPDTVYLHIPVYNALKSPDTNRVTTSVFMKSTDGGATWTQSTGVADNAVFSEMFFAPDGTMFHFFAYTVEELLGEVPWVLIAFQVSHDGGETWLPNSAARIVERAQRNTVRTPDEQTNVEVSGITVTIDEATGTIYLVWPDFRFNVGPANDVLLMQSTDFGATWSTPIKINQTPASANPLRAQTFLSDVAARNGTVVVTYYDFRNDDGTGELADTFAVVCAADCSQQASWGTEVRLTDVSFDLTTAVLKDQNSLFLGDYLGLATAGGNFYAVFPTTTTETGNASDVYFRRLTPQFAP